MSLTKTCFCSQLYGNQFPFSCIFTTTGASKHLSSKKKFSEWYQINFEFRTIRDSLFHKPVTGREYFLETCYSWLFSSESKGQVPCVKILGKCSFCLVKLAPNKIKKWQTKSGLNTKNIFRVCNWNFLAVSSILNSTILFCIIKNPLRL